MVDKIEWIKSSFCDSSACIEVARVNGIAIRNTSEPEDVIVASEEEWAKFLLGAKAGDFDLE